MKKFVFVFVLMCSMLISCTLHKNAISYGSSSVIGQTEISSQVINSQKYEVKRNDFNSLCARFDIPSDLKLWQSYDFRDYETNIPIKELVYMKNNQYNNVYRVKLDIINNDTTFVLIHRTISNR